MPPFRPLMAQRRVVARAVDRHGMRPRVLSNVLSNALLEIHSRGGGARVAGHLGAAATMTRARPVSTATAGSRRRRANAERNRDVPLYEFPLSVLDLDAEDNPFVRPYNEVIEAEETARWRAAHASIDALAERLEAHAKDSKLATLRMKAVAAMPNVWRVTDRDILSAALLGTEELGRLVDRRNAELRGTQADSSARRGEETREAQEVQEVQEVQETLGRAAGRPHDGSEAGKEAVIMAELLARNGISSRVAADRGTALTYLLHRQDLWRKASSIGGSGGSDSRLDTATKLRKALAACHSVTATRRLLAFASQTPEGCAVVGECARPVAARLADLAGVSTKNTKNPASSDGVELKLRAAEVSQTLLNLTYSFETHGVDFGPPLCGVGLRAAAASGAPVVALKRFLQMALSAGHLPSVDPTAEPAASVLSALATIHEALASASASTSPWDGSQTELFALLTGQTPLSAVRRLMPTSHEVSFRRALTAPRSLRRRGHGNPLLLGATETPAQRDMYLAVLADLGAVRTLWEELHSIRVGQGSDETTRADPADPDTLVSAVLRYAAYVEGTHMAATTTATDAANGAGDAQDEPVSSSLLDLRTVAAYEAATATPAQGPSVLPTLRPATGAAAHLTSRQSPMGVDGAFRARVVKAFARETVASAMTDIGALLARQGVDRGAS